MLKGNTETHRGKAQSAILLTARRAVAMTSILATLTGCSISPIVKVDPSKVNATPYQTVTPLPKAVAYAKAVQDAYLERISDQVLLEYATGLGLITLTGAAAGLGAAGIGKEFILGAGAGGAAAYASSQLLTSRLQQMIYSEGSRVLSCAVSAMAPQRKTYEYLGELKELVEGAPKTAKGSIREDLDALNILIQADADKSAITQLAYYVDARQAFVDGTNAEERGEKAIDEMDNFGETLLSAVGEIEAQVRHELLNVRPDLTSFYNALGQTIPQTANQIAGKPGLFLAPGEAPKAKVITQKQKDFEAATSRVEQKARRINIIADKIGDKPAADTLQNCRFDLQRAGISFRVSPSGEVSVDASSATRLQTFDADGGVPPYEAAWSGETPTEKVEIKSVDRFSGTFTVEIQKGAPSGKYGLRIKDAGRGEATITLNIQGTSSGSSGSAGSSGGAAGNTSSNRGADRSSDRANVDNPAPAKASPTKPVIAVPTEPIKPPTVSAPDRQAATPSSADVRKVQTALIKEGFERVTIRGTEMTVKVNDELDDATRASIFRLLLTRAGMKPAQIPKDDAGLVEAAKKYLKL